MSSASTLRSSAPTTIFVALVVSAIAFASDMMAAENDRSVIGLNELITDVLPLHQKAQELATLNSAPDEVAAVTARRPQETAAWRGLHIGEFEADTAFKGRQKQARDQEDKAYQAAMEKWKHDLAIAIERRSSLASRRAIIESRDVLPKLVARGSEKPIGAMIGLAQRPTLTLPYFDRSRMVFDHFQFPGAMTEVNYQGSNTVLGRFTTSPSDLRIKCSDLGVAQRFKEDVATGRIRFAIWVEPWLTQIESPIVTKPAHDEQEIDKGAVAKSALEYLIVAAGSALGADPNSVNQAGAMAGDDVAHRDHHKLVHYPAETRDGVRFVFNLDTVLIAAIDDNGKQLPGVQIEFANRPEAAVRFMGFKEDAQPAAKVLKPGDQILSVAGRKVRNAHDFIAAVKAQPAGVTFKVSYRAVEDGREHSFIANGGRLLGISLIDVFPGNRVRISN